MWLLVTLSGFIVYRYRETRAMTMAQFFEMRYSRRFRIFMGALAWTAGLINYGIFPVVGARFFVLFLDLPLSVDILGGAVPTYVLVMAALLATNVAFVCVGGQLTAMATDCVEGLIAGVFLLALMLGVMWVFDWSQMSSALLDRPPGESLANPFDAAKITDFNLCFVLIGVFAGVYSYMAWQGNSGFNASAASPHEAKMGRILGQWRSYARAAAITLLGIAAITYMHHPDFAIGAARVNAEVATLADQVPPARPWCRWRCASFCRRASRACSPPSCCSRLWRATPAKCTRGAASSCRTCSCPCARHAVSVRCHGPNTCDGCG